MKKYLISQWDESLARSIWIDLTVIGRITIFIPAWLLCWLMVIIIVPILPIAWLADKLLDKPLTFIYRLFFKP